MVGMIRSRETSSSASLLARIQAATEGATLELAAAGTAASAEALSSSESAMPSTSRRPSGVTTATARGAPNASTPPSSVDARSAPQRNNTPGSGADSSGR
jgi:hypothetical protein